MSCSPSASYAPSRPASARRDPAPYRAVHTSPEDAVQAFVDLKSRWMVPMHYGTFRLSYEPVEEPLERLAAEAKRRRIEKRVCVLEEGVTTLFE